MHLLRSACLVLAVVLTVTACGDDAADLTPKVIGKRLDIAKSDLESVGVEEEAIEVVGGGTVGAIDESNWIVCDQEPEAGVELSGEPRLLIDRNCGPEDVFEAASPRAASPEADTAQDGSPASITPSPSPEGPPPEVKLDTCEKRGIEVIASGTIRNVDTVSRTFAVSVEFYDNGGAKIEQGIDFVSVEAGQIARWRQDNFTEEEYTLGDCKVVDVS